LSSFPIGAQARMPRGPLGEARRPLAAMLSPMLRGEFTIYPFIEGPEPPNHVVAAMEAIREVGLEAELGPLGQTVLGPADVVLDALRRAEVAALAAGATSIVIRLEVVE
jgi:uncharacterized protein YqgV (UPF0045/DUF77 family)